MTWLDVVQSVSIIIAAISVFLGVNAWRREFVGKRRIELAEEVLALFYQARDIIAQIRNPFSYGGEGKSRQRNENESAEESQIYDNAYVAFERYNANKEFFSNIAAIRYRFMAIFGEERAEPFNELTHTVNQILIAAQMLPGYWKDQGNRVGNDKTQFEKQLEQMRKYEADFWYQGSGDIIAARVDMIVVRMEKYCQDIILNPHFHQRILSSIKKIRNLKSAKDSA